jgi:hypothetical protein
MPTVKKPQSLYSVYIFKNFPLEKNETLFTGYITRQFPELGQNESCQPRLDKWYVPIV